MQLVPAPAEDAPGYERIRTFGAHMDVGDIKCRRGVGGLAERRNGQQGDMSTSFDVDACSPDCVYWIFEFVLSVPRLYTWRTTRQDTLDTVRPCIAVTPVRSRTIYLLRFLTKGAVFSYQSLPAAAAHTSITGPEDTGGGDEAPCSLLRSVTTSATQPVHVGSRSATGNNSRANVGRSRG
jgi:hypothetical protein